MAASSCAPNTLTQLPSGSGQIETSAAAQALPTPIESEAHVSATSTDVYTSLARAIHACWFGAGGPLRATHVFHAEAKSAADGGKADISIHERDLVQREQRGQEAFHIAIEPVVTGARVKTSIIKLPPGFGEAMARDVQVWAKGGSGCQLRASFPQPEEKPPPPKATKGKR